MIIPGFSPIVFAPASKSQEHVYNVTEYKRRMRSALDDLALEPVRMGADRRPLPVEFARTIDALRRSGIELGEGARLEWDTDRLGWSIVS